MDLAWIDPAHPAPRQLDGAVAVLTAANEVDSPHRLPENTSFLTTVLRHGWDGDPISIAVALDPHGAVTGVLQLHLPQWDNQHLAYLELAVDPLRRCTGIGRRLFDVAVDRARATGRTVVTVGGYDSSAATGFAKALGLDRASEELERRQLLATRDRTALRQLAVDAERRSAGYELLRLGAWTPDELLPDVARLTAAINDAPTDDLDIEDEVYTPPRLRAFEAAQLVQGRRMYRLVARERATGALAGQTLVAVNPEQPGFGWQYDTSVARDHRGHRLGLRLKLGMLDWLEEVEPQLRVLDTSNAATNDHMIAVNEALGYRVVARAVIWQRRL